MQTHRPTLLLTRPKAQSVHFAARFHARFGADWPLVISPLARTRFLAAPLATAGFGHIVFTSQNAVAAFARLSPARDLLAWCVGERTAIAARDAGFQVSVGPGSAQALAGQIIAAGRVEKLLYPRAVNIAFDMKKALESAGIETCEAVAYDQVPCLPGKDALALMAGSLPVLLPVFSHQTARQICRIFPKPSAPVLVAAISAEVALAVEIPQAACAIAARPDSAHMLDALAELIAGKVTP